MSSATEHSEFTLCSMNNAYLRACKKAKRALISHNCIHKQLQSENTLELVKRMLSDLMKALSGKSLRRKIKNLFSEDLQSLLEKLGVDDIILIDGTEIDVSYSCIDNFDCQGKVRPHDDGTPPRPGLKLHIAFSFLKQSFEYVEITEAVG